MNSQKIVSIKQNYDVCYIVMAGIFLSMFVSMFFKFGIIDTCIILSLMVWSCEAMYDFQSCNERWSWWLLTCIIKVIITCHIAFHVLFSISQDLSQSGPVQ